ncbi:MAG: hypothetical protein ACKPJD_19385, partial [Planctomycetaceae bacterium]
MRRRPVISGQWASRGRESAGGAFYVARAFQPEICPSAFGVRAVCLTRSREVAKEVAQGGGEWVFFE